MSAWKPERRLLTVGPRRNKKIMDDYQVQVSGDAI